MKTYQKAELIAKNLPTGSYAAGCPAHHKIDRSFVADSTGCTYPAPQGCYVCELAG